ncbi:hypothetical protein FGRMN_9994 [Fusarium graminum]|nr:hypothetical protein FGRMN_9994 [Fusarium graminum]
MRFTSIFVAGAFATMAAAQSKTSGLSPAQESQAECLSECKPGDVKCQSYCITVPSPNEKNIEDTTKCAANCDQGNGSASATEKYSACVQDCIANNYWKSVDGSPRGTDVPDASEISSIVSTAVKSAISKATASASDEDTTATASESEATATGASKTLSDAKESASGTAASASASETGNAANVLVGGVSFLGLVAAVLAL